MNDETLSEWWQVGIPDPSWSHPRFTLNGFDDNGDPIFGDPGHAARFDTRDAAADAIAKIVKRHGGTYSITRWEMNPD